MNPYKLSVKVGSAEFSAEGPEAAVKEQFAAFLEIVSSQPVAGTKPADAKRLPADTPEVPSVVIGNGTFEPGVDRSCLDEAYIVDSKGLVSLRTLPPTEDRQADTLILLMYGHRALRQQPNVSADALINGARQSGLTLDRLDRVLGGYTHLHRKGGVRRGTRYTLNNPGIAHAEGILREMFE
jgi:hypothetical protein